MKIGDSVIIKSISTKRYKNYIHEGIIATIMDIRNDIKSDYRIAIKIDCIPNPGSSKGYFWFMSKELENINIKENITMMNKQNLIPGYKISLTKDVKGVCPTYCAYYGELKEGDMVVIAYDKNRYATRFVTSADLPVDEYKNEIEAEVVNVVDTTDYEKRLISIYRRAELKKLLDEKAKQLQEEQYWAILSEMDPEMKKLYEEYKTYG